MNPLKFVKEVVLNMLYGIREQADAIILTTVSIGICVPVVFLLLKFPRFGMFSLLLMLIAQVCLMVYHTYQDGKYVRLQDFKDK